MEFRGISTSPLTSRKQLYAAPPDFLRRALSNYWVPPLTVSTDRIWQFTRDKKFRTENKERTLFSLLASEKTLPAELNRMDLGLLFLPHHDFKKLARDMGVKNIADLLSRNITSLASKLEEDSLLGIAERLQSFLSGQILRDREKFFFERKRIDQIIAEFDHNHYPLWCLILEQPEIPGELYDKNLRLVLSLKARKTLEKTNIKTVAQLLEMDVKYIDKNIRAEVVGSLWDLVEKISPQNLFSLKEKISRLSLNQDEVSRVLNMQKDDLREENRTLAVLLLGNEKIPEFLNTLKPGELRIKESVYRHIMRHGVESVGALLRMKVSDFFSWGNFREVKFKELVWGIASLLEKNILSLVERKDSEIASDFISSPQGITWLTNFRLLKGDPNLLKLNEEEIKNLFLKSRRELYGCNRTLASQIIMENEIPEELYKMDLSYLLLNARMYPLIVGISDNLGGLLESRVSEIVAKDGVGERAFREKLLWKLVCFLDGKALEKRTEKEGLFGEARPKHMIDRFAVYHFALWYLFLEKPEISSWLYQAEIKKHLKIDKDVYPYFKGTGTEKIGKLLELPLFKLSDEYRFSPDDFGCLLKSLCEFFNAQRGVNLLPLWKEYFDLK